MYHRVSSLRLIKPDMDILQTINVAVTFEQKTCMDNPDEVSWILLSVKIQRRDHTKTCKDVV